MNRIYEVNFGKYISELFNQHRRVHESEYLTIAREEARKYIEERKLIPFWRREQIVYENLSLVKKKEGVK